MDRLEQMVRDSLRNRAEDVEPTPALWREVERKLARRRRLRVLTWVPAGAAVLAAAVAIPLALSGGPDIPDIADLPDEQLLTLGPAVPQRAITVSSDGGLRALDLRDGGVLGLGGVRLAGEVPTVRVPPGEVGDQPMFVVQYAAETGPTVRTNRPEGWGIRTLDPLDELAGGVAVSADGRWYATLTRGLDADGWSLRATTTAEEHVGLEDVELGIVVPAGSRLQDWRDSPGRTGVTELTVRTPEGRLLGFPLVEGEDGSFEWLDETVERVLGDLEVLAYAAGHLDDGAHYWLTEADDGAVLRYGTGVEAQGEVDVTELVGSADPATLDLDAWGHGAIVSADTGAWFLAHDGSGSFVDPVALPEGTLRAALVGRELPVTEPEPDEEPPTVEDPEVVEGDLALPGPVVVASADRVVLRRGGDEQVLTEFPSEGHSTVQHVAVRPGATSDDLTVVMTTSAEGFTDLRYVEVVDGSVRPPGEEAIDDGEVVELPEMDTPPAQPITDPPLAPVSATNDQVVIEGLAWSPDGSRLAWLERNRDGTGSALRTIAWDDAGPGGDDEANDDISWPAPELDATGTQLTDWVDVGGGQTHLRFVDPDGEPGWWSWAFAFGGDGLPGTDGGPEFVGRPGGQVLGLAGVDDEGQPAWYLVTTDDGPVIEAAGTGDRFSAPSELLPGEGLPETWLRTLGDGVLVGGGGQAWYQEAAGHTDLGTAVDAAPVR